MYRPYRATPRRATRVPSDSPGGPGAGTSPKNTARAFSTPSGPHWRRCKSVRTTWVNYSIHGPPTPPTQKFNFWPRRAPGPTQNSGAHRGEPIPPIPIEIRCNWTDFGPKNGLDHVFSSLPRFCPSGPPGREARGPGGQGVRLCSPSTVCTRNQI